MSDLAICLAALLATTPGGGHMPQREELVKAVEEYAQLGGFPDKRGGEKALLDGKRYTEMPA